MIWQSDTLVFPKCMLLLYHCMAGYASLMRLSEFPSVVLEYPDYELGALPFGHRQALFPPPPRLESSNLYLKCRRQPGSHSPMFTCRFLHCDVPTTNPRTTVKFVPSRAILHFCEAVSKVKDGGVHI